MENRIAELRKNAGLSQVELARKLGFTRSYMNKIERGKTPINTVLAIRIANILDCTLDDLFFNTKR